MEIFVLINQNDKSVRTFSKKEIAIAAHLQISKDYYQDRYDRAVRQSIAELKRAEEYSKMPEKTKEDLINFMQGKEYEGLFTIEELNSLDTMIRIEVTTLDAQ